MFLAGHLMLRMLCGFPHCKVVVFGREQERCGFKQIQTQCVCFVADKTQNWIPALPAGNLPQVFFGHTNATGTGLGPENASTQASAHLSMTPIVHE